MDQLSILFKNILQLKIQIEAQIAFLNDEVESNKQTWSNLLNALTNKPTVQEIFKKSKP
jgi:hypothetical protein